jgi:hypothetical protein
MDNRAQRQTVRDKSSLLDYLRGIPRIGTPEEEADKASERIIGDLKKERQTARAVSSGRKKK